jgi:hypothetical protein
MKTLTLTTMQAKLVLEAVVNERICALPTEFESAQDYESYITDCRKIEQQLTAQGVAL